MSKSDLPHPPIAPRSEEKGRNFGYLPSVPKKKNTSLACLACRGRKSKCNGGPPCDACVRAKTECVVDETSDLRRRIHWTRKLEETERERDIFNRIFAVLRDQESEQAMQLLGLIRSNASLQEIEAYLDPSQETSKLVKSSSNLERPTTVRRILDTEQFLNIRAFPVPARPWTTVTDDDDFVSHLISLWFTWFQPCFNWIDRDLFMRDMLSGNPRSQYCSPFLVNAILAHACMYSNLAAAYANPADPTTRGVHFYEEAKRVLAGGGGVIELPTIQGLCSLFVCALTFGDESAAWTYLAQVASAVQEYSKTHPPIAGGVGQAASAFDTVISRTVWGVYNIATASALSYQKAPILRRPVQGLTVADHSNPSDTWYPYPSLSDGIHGHTQCLFNSHCGLADIIAGLCLPLFDEGLHLTPAEIYRVITSAYAQLQDWYGNLPACLAATQERPLPQFLTLHIYYYASLIAIFSYLDDAHGEEKGKHRQSDQYSNMLPSSAREIARLVALQRSTWGVHMFPSFSMDWVTKALLALLNDINNPQSHEAFLDLFDTAVLAARRWEHANRALGAVQLAAEQKGMILRAEV